MLRATFAALALSAGLLAAPPGHAGTAAPVGVWHLDAKTFQIKADKTRQAARASLTSRKLSRREWLYLESYLQRQEPRVRQLLRATVEFKPNGAVVVHRADGALVDRGRWKLDGARVMATGLQGREDERILGNVVNARRLSFPPQRQPGDRPNDEIIKDLSYPLTRASSR